MQQPPQDATPPQVASFQALLVPIGAPGGDGVRDANSVSFFDLIDEIKRNWITVVGVAALVVIATVAAVLMMKPVYRATVVVSPRSQSSTEGMTRSLFSQLGGLASLAGMVVGSGSTSEAEAIAVLQSRQLAERFIAREQLLPQLFADEWDAAAGRWAVPEKDVPSLADAYRTFNKNLRKVDHDRKTGIVTLSIDWSDPAQAARWANGIVALANDSMRARAVEEAQATLKYLDAEIEKATQLPMRDALYQLVEAQQKALMVANTRVDFAFRIIDPATVPEPRDRIWPKRRLMVAGSVIAGLVLGVVLVVGRFLWRRARASHVTQRTTLA